MTGTDETFTLIPAHQLDILRPMKVSVVQAVAITTVDRPNLIVDGAIDYSLQGAPRGMASHLIQWANQQAAPILSLDVPSGTDTATGTVYEPAIRARATMTLALPKEGLRAPGVEARVGEGYLADISVPPGLYAEATLALEVGNLFAESEIFRLR